MRSYAVLSLAVLVICGAASRADAAIIQAEDRTHQVSTDAQDGSIDIFFAPDATLPIDLTAFQIRLTVEGALAGLRVIGARGPQTHPYAFAPASDGPSTSASAAAVTASDIVFAETVTVNANEGLASIQYRIDPGAFGVFNFSLDPNQSFLHDADGNPVPFTYQGGTITVTAAAIPEPASAAALSILFAAGFYRARRSRKEQRHQLS